MEKYRQFSYTNIKNGIPFYREWTVPAEEEQTPEDLKANAELLEKHAANQPVVSLVTLTENHENSREPL